MRKKDRDRITKSIIKATDNPQYYLDNLKDILVFDTETTGLDTNSEILQLSITNGLGDTLFNEYLKPTHNTSWSEAQSVHHVSPEMVADKLTFGDYFDEIQNMFYNAKMIAGYNTSYDINYILKNDIVLNNQVPIYDVMLAFAPVYGEWNYRFKEYKWQHLDKCAKYFGYDLGSKAHNSLEDTKATAYCLEQLLKLELKKQ